MAKYQISPQQKPKSGYAESVSLRAVMAPCSMPSILWGVHRIDDEHYKDDDDTLRSAAWDCSASGTNESLAAFGAMTPRNRHMGFADSAPTAIPLTLPIPCGDQLHRDEVDDAFLDYDGLVLLQTNTVPFFMSSVIGCTASLSDDTSALTGILPPHLLNDEQANTDYEARWVWVVQQTALPRPEEHPDMRLFRVRIAAPPAIPDALINFPPGVDAWDSMDHLVTLWPDLRYSRDRIRWRAIKVHESVRFGLATDADIPSYIIVTEDERDVGPFRDVLVETQYHTHMSTTIDAAGRRLTSSLTFPSLLAQIGLIAPCSMTHECTAKKNGRPVPDHQGVRLLDGDFILVELLERPPARLGLLDDGSRGDAQLLEETTSQASPPPEAEHEGPAIYVVHRPRFRATDSRVCWIASDTRSTINELLIARHWPDLRNNEYYTLAVHKSLQRDMLILPDVDFLPRPQVRGVLVYLRVDKVQDLYAVPLATRTSAYGLYYWAGILPFCQQTPSQCGAWINGERIYGAASARLTHADYVKIAFWQPDTQPAELQPIALQEYDPIHATYTEGSPYRTAGSNPSDDDAALMPTGSPAPMDAVPTSDLYWICAALYAYLGGFLLLRCQCGRQRRTTKLRLKSRSMPACATWLFIGLLLSQHVQPVATMMLRNRAILYMDGHSVRCGYTTHSLLQGILRLATHLLFWGGRKLIIGKAYLLQRFLAKVFDPFSHP